MTAEPGPHRPLGGRLAGFTLLEVLVALIIFALAFGALAGLFQTTLRQTRAADELRRTTAFAESQLARFGKDLPLRSGRVEGLSDDGITWQAEVALAAPVDADGDIALYRIRIEAGPAGGLSDLISLTTLRIGAP